MNSKVMNSCRTLLAVLLFSAVAGCGNSDNARLFEEVTLTSGIKDSGMTFGASWGDFNDDGLPDLYTSNHGNPAVLYQNLGKGHFKEVTSDYFTQTDLEGDKHGATWVDFDNDGDQDLLLLRGGGRGVGVGPNSLFINSDNGFEEKAVALGIDNPYARTRMQLFYDFNNDGYLDVFLGALERADGKAPASIFLQQNGIFKQSSDYGAFASASVPFCILALINTRDRTDLVCRVQGAKDRAGQIFSSSDVHLTESNQLPRTHFDDIAAGDFDGDLSMDLFLARKSTNGPLLFGRRGDNEVIADVKINHKNVTDKIGFDLQTSGELTIEILSAPNEDLLPPENIKIGAFGHNPDTRKFKLSQDIPGIEQMVELVSGEQVAVHIQRMPVNTWSFYVSGDKKWSSDRNNEPLQITLNIQSSHKIEHLTAHGTEVNPGFAADRLLMNVQGTLEKAGDARGVNEPLTNSVSTVAGDFDNDMDLDLYIVSSTSVENHENKLLINDGHGNFKPMNRAGGAPGTRTGVGDAVAMADYDMDGFLDLLVVNGGSMGRSYGLSAKDGGYQLYHNIGNDNHWLEIDLEGSRSNRDGIGAVVYVTSGGVTQVRIQDGGVHNRTQNHQRLHFGLAQNKIIEKITIKWPSGTVQELNNISVDQLLHIKESRFGVK